MALKLLLHGVTIQSSKDEEHFGRCMTNIERGTTIGGRSLSDAPDTDDSEEHEKQGSYGSVTIDLALS